MKHRFLTLFLSAILCLALTACGEDPELTKFKKELDNFCSQIEEIDAGMNNIDATSETAKEDLLDYLDRADDNFRKLANLSVPEEFAYIEELADKASEDMTQAVTLYHDAFSNNSFNEYTFDYASEYYKRAFKRLTYIITLLHGDVPESDGVIIYDEEDVEISVTSTAE